ncbi:SPASM domain-containing protein [Streptomyces sp. NBC_01538]
MRSTPSSATNAAPPTCSSSRSWNAPPLEHNGDLYSCDHFVEPEHLLGNIGDRHMLELVDSPRQRKFGQDKHDTLPRYCLDCDVRFACHGGCPKDRFDTTSDGEAGLKHLCAGFKTFFHHIDRPMRTMTELLRQGQAPALIMRRYADADADRPHNAPCPCAGGRKWARCHGRPVTTGQP